MIGAPGNVGRGIQAGTHSVSGDPLLMGYVRDGVCDDDLHLTANSPLVNTGDPARNDLDGTRSDIGAFGGPDAPASTVLDGDNDGTVDAYDCAPSDPAIHPDLGPAWAVGKRRRTQQSRPPAPRRAAATKMWS